MKKTYLGDGLYASFDGYGIQLTAENGIEISDRVYVEPQVYEALIQFARSINTEHNVNHFQEPSA